MKDRDRTLFIIIMPQFSSGCPILKRKQNYDFLWQIFFPFELAFLTILPQNVIVYIFL